MSSDSNMGYLHRPDTNMPQGSAYTYTYYDIADEVIPASPVHDIEMSKLIAPIQLAEAPKAGERMIPPSAPLVDVPPIPTIDDMRNSAMSSNLQPELQEFDGPRSPRPPRSSPKPRPKALHLVIEDHTQMITLSHTTKVQKILETLQHHPTTIMI